MKLLRFRIGASEEEAETAALEQEIRAAAARNYWCRKFGDPELDEIVEEHRAWVESRGELGKKAELEDANFQDADLMGAQLSGANLLRANLRGADLLVADLRGACLIEADFSEANLVNTNLRGASLAGANLATATGLVARQLGGASLIGAALPETLFPFEGIAKSASVCRILRILLGGMLAMCACLWAVVALTTDVALVKNAAAPLPLLGRFIPILAFYLAAPMLLAAVYIGFHSYLQKLWEAMDELPAVFPDGRRLGECVPASMMALAPRSLREAEPEQRKFPRLRRALWHLAGYWIVPATLVLVWARYLTEQDWRGSLLQIFFILAAAAMSGFLPHNEASMFAAAEPEERGKGKLWGSWHVGGLTVATSAGCLFLVLLTLGATLGAPGELSRAPSLSAKDFRRWPAFVFGLAGYDPFPNLLNARISTAPSASASSGEPADLKLVHGARLANANLRYARASGAFFAKAQMEHADLTGGDFASADFRVANLSSANLTAASLFRADFLNADLRYAMLREVTGGGAIFDNANLYRAGFVGAIMERASFAKADLRSATLSNVDLSQADFSAAYLAEADFSGARLEQARFHGAFADGAKFQNADLRAAVFNEAILNGAKFDGADLDRTDLRGALGLTGWQVCAAKSHTGAQFDDSLARDVQAVCGNL